MIYENNVLLAESQRFAATSRSSWPTSTWNVCAQERMRLTSFNDPVGEGWTRSSRFAAFRSTCDCRKSRWNCCATWSATLTYPSDPHRDLDARCYEAYNIQVHGLMKRLSSTGIKKVVIGVSGGLDSTQALLVAAQTMDRLGLPRTDVLGYSLPGFATGNKRGPMPTVSCQPWCHGRRDRHPALRDADARGHRASVRAR